MSKTEIGHILAQLRTQKGLNQRELAQHIGVSNGAIGMWETDKRQPDLDTIVTLSQYYNVSTDYLLGVDMSPTKGIGIPSELQNIFNIYNQDPDRVTELLQSFSKLSNRNKTIILGKCYELENDDNTEKKSYPSEQPKHA